MMNYIPLKQEIPYANPATIFKCFSNQPWSMLLNSADAHQSHQETNRFSYIAFDPFRKIFIKNKKNVIDNEAVNNPFQFLKKILSQYKVQSIPHLPAFQGGALGYFSYDLCHYLEQINFPGHIEINSYADLAVGIYDIIISFDHLSKKSWIVATGFTEQHREVNLERAQQRINFCLDQLHHMPDSHSHDDETTVSISLKSPFTKKTYSELVRKAQHYILEGDIFQVNLSHRFQATLPHQHYDTYQLYLKMSAQNPSPFSAYLNLGDHQILSSSPERFLLVEGKKVSTRPIKGTALRSNDASEDKLRADSLVASEKDRSENIMITDLLRNDLSKVCTPESVTVKKLCGLESYPTVHHLVSVIEGTLEPSYTALDLLEACFPGGSITGAPKVRAMQIIYELEPTARGPYCGCLGFIGFNGDMDTSIIIRTVLSQGNMISYQAGGAVVLSSSPIAEYDETLAKSAAIKKTLNDWELT